MHAATVLQKCLGGVFEPMHAARRQALLGAVTALLNSRRLILMELARAWPGALRVRAPLKRLDRLLGNPHLAGEAPRCYAAMARWLVRTSQPIVVVDWSELKADGRWQLLRAGIPVGSRTLTVLEAVYPEQEKNAPRVERQFLERLRSVLPQGVKPIIVTDAGFRAPWFRAVRSLGWDYVGRLRHRALVQLGPGTSWIANRRLHTRARSRPQRFRDVHIVRNEPWRCDLVLLRRHRRGRRHLNAHGTPAHSHKSLKAARAQREPWLLATSLTGFSSRQIVAIYAKRMQIEQSFRDLKSARYGCAFRYSLTRTAPRLAMLLLLHALATFVAYLAALASDRSTAVRYGGILTVRVHRHYSRLRLGWEALRRGSTLFTVRHLWQCFKHPPRWALQELRIPG
ncbi:MAG: IS4 family transposase [Gammaproteobacteria bacterium]